MGCGAITTLKRGSLYVQPLAGGGKKAAGHMNRYFQWENRYRDTAVHPDGKTIYIATDSQGIAESRTGGVTTEMENKGAILAFTYVGEGGGEVSDAAPAVSRRAEEPQRSTAARSGIAPQFTAKQISDGKKSYDSYCAVCHGSTLKNGTFGSPLAGEYFQSKWSGKSVAAFHSKSRTMPPASPASLAAEVYANIVAYILAVNGHQAGAAPLPHDEGALNGMTIR